MCVRALTSLASPALNVTRILALYVTLKLVIAVQAVASRKREAHEGADQCDMKSHPGLLFLADRPGQTLLDLDHVTVRPLQSAACGDVVLIALLHFGLAIEEEVDVIAGQPGIQQATQAADRELLVLLNAA